MKEITELIEPFQDIPLGIGIVGNGYIRFANQKLCEMLGYDAEELDNQDLAVFFSDMDFRNPAGFASQLPEKTQETSQEVYLKRKSGDVITVLLTVSPLNPEAPSPDFLFTAVDISKQKKIEAAYKESEGQFRSLMESATSFAVYRLEPDESSPIKARVVFVSPSIKEIVGTSEPMNLMAWYETIHPDDLERVIETNMQAFKKDEFNDTWRIIHPAKKGIRWIHAIAKGVYDSEGNIKYINGIFLDVSDQKQAEEALSKKEAELKENSRSLEELNTALRVLLKKRDENKAELVNNILSEAKEYLLPYVEKLKRTASDDRQKTLMGIIHSNMTDLISPLPRRLVSKKLTPSELLVANLIKLGKTSKEIATLLNLSVKTIDTHRRNIRKKLGIRSKKQSLQARLKSIQE